jgi:peptidoglycan/xylan/chitin deacetylase (PgdA/CDA1 family)
VLASHGNEIADHTWAHEDLTSLTYEGARRSIRRAADAIEALIGIRPEALAYPAGRFNPMAVAAAEAEGMNVAFTTQHGSSDSIASRLAEPRLRVNGLIRRADGSYVNGTTALGLLWLLSPHAGP